MFTKPFKKAGVENITQYYREGHSALDLVPFRKGLLPYGTPLVSPEDGTVIEMYTTDINFGFGLRIKGDSGYTHLIWHTQPVMPVDLNERVKRGQIVAYCGNSGNVFVNGQYVPITERNIPNFKGTHLHLECVKNDVRENPFPLFDWQTEPTYTIFDELTAMGKTLVKISRLVK